MVSANDHRGSIYTAPVGTDAWVNWRMSLEAGHEIENFEDELHSDRSFVGNAVSMGPYQLFAAMQKRRRTTTGPAIIVHVQLVADPMPQLIDGQGNLTKGTTAGYHGGSIGDEIAALMSLELGVRVRFAGTRRSSGIHRPDSHLSPLYFDVPPVHVPDRAGREMLPRAMRRPTDLRSLDALKLFPRLKEKKQLALVRAARSYANGLWWANEDPNLAWLQLVTAVEAAARESETIDDDDLVEILRDYDPLLWKAIESVDDETRRKIARVRVPMMGVTRKFTEFIVARAEQPPDDERPENFDRFDWAELRPAVTQIYRLRSTALHEGTPFPMPMLQEPAVATGGDGAIQETPGGLSAAGLGGIWHAKRTPMLLSTFEQIARSALLSWWLEG